MDWLPLELWRASSLAQETRTCEAAYEKLSKSSNTAALSALRKSIEGRIDELEAFFIDNLDDERAVLFEKQRLKLRKLLQDYSVPTTASPGLNTSASDGRAGVGGGDKGTKPHPAQDSDGGAASGAGRTRLRADADKAAYYAPPPPPQPPLPASAGGSADPRLRASGGPSGQGAPLVTPAKVGASSGSVINGSPSEAGGSTAGRSKKKKPAPIYDWEKRALKKEKEAARRAGDDSLASALPADDDEESDASDAEPVGMMDTMVEFQVRMSEAEYKQLIVRRRRKAAEEKFFVRANKVVEASRQRAVEIATERGASGIAVTGPYVEPALLETHLYRTPQPKKWLNEKGFEYLAKPVRAAGAKP